VPSVAAAPFDHGRVAETARRKFILPGYRAFQDAAVRLDERIGRLCETPSSDRLQGARAAYRDVIAAWGRIEIIAFGPVMAENRYERIFFWPDRKGIGQRQVRRILTKKDQSATTREGLSEKSVAVQGLTALEMVLYGDGSAALAEPGSDEFRCRYGDAIAANLAEIAGTVAKTWADGGAFQKVWSMPGADNPAYIFPRETTQELVKALEQGLGMIRDRRIAPSVGLGRDRRRSRPVLGRSKLTFVLVHANLAGLRYLFETGGLADAYVAANDGTEEATGDVSSILSEFKLTLGALAKLADEADPFAGDDIKGRLVALGFPLKNIRNQAVGRLKQAAGLSMGFNASDGD